MQIQVWRLVGPQVAQGGDPLTSTGYDQFGASMDSDWGTGV